ncbi:6,7-dimethyl-8-ribityllumazine synthase [Roseovarius pacificus]|uniref:6,7-dimethyl-8-ribityllumazine synthase n=1 Tax=Roseovarius pacificus TaxID=337701 RepID=A0A1M7KKB5_9RHOB|nr:6,7-dimethyl-8-ribityllumazine synthase [Roseovarius pacificus]GGO62952.1 6,7-dimethyl-8-ribityllumazine synthase [Roseovarius pacificus]SHM65796.1 6,7-dimethyl-8-ribityllumazine synthase [Roseovarius pacificus]
MEKPLKIAYVKAQWHADVVDQSLKGFEAEMKISGTPVVITVFNVPGAFEMPLLAKRLGQTGKFDAVVAAALVVDGGIYRHDFVAQAVVSGLMQAQMESSVPTFSVSLTPHNYQDTPEHISFFSEHFVKKGAEAARAVIQIFNIEVPLVS